MSNLKKRDRKEDDDGDDDSTSIEKGNNVPPNKRRMLKKKSCLGRTSEKRNQNLRFYPMVDVMHVPTISDFENAGVANHIWYSSLEIKSIITSANSDIKQFVRSHSNKIEKGMNARDILKLCITEECE